MWLQLEMKRQVADIYTAVRALRQQSIKTRILVPQEDTRLRTAEGRRQADLVATIARDEVRRGGACPHFNGPSRPGNAKSAPQRVSKVITSSATMSSMAAPDKENYRKQNRLADLQEARAAQRAFELSTDDAMQRFADLFVSHRQNCISQSSNR